MITTSDEKVRLTPREKQVLEGLADGLTLPDVALRLRIRTGTAAGYLKLAKQKLHDIGPYPALVAVAYASGAIPEPTPLDPEELDLSRRQRALVPLIVRGMRTAQMAAELNRPIDIVREDSRELMANLKAHSPAHSVTRTWQYGLLDAELVRALLPGRRHGLRRPNH